MPPDIGWCLAARCFFGTYETGCHVGNAVGGVEIEGIDGGVTGVPEDVVVLRGPTFCGACAVVVGPDDFVLEAGATSTAIEGKDLVE